MAACRGCGLGWSKECDNPGYMNFPFCGCGAVHNHDSMVKSACEPLYWPNGSLVTPTLRQQEGRNG